MTVDLEFVWRTDTELRRLLYSSYPYQFLIQIDHSLFEIEGENSQLVISMKVASSFYPKIRRHQATFTRSAAANERKPSVKLEAPGFSTSHCSGH